MNYKLINKLTGEEHICQKMVVDGWDYYVSDEIIEEGWKGTAYKKDVKGQIFKHFYTTNDWYKDAKKVIATNNPNIDIPKVVDKVEQLAHKYFAEERFNWEQGNPNGLKSPQSLVEHYNKTFTPLFKAGYNKSQKTHPFSEEDMIEFAKFSIKNNFCKEENRYYQYWELLQLWREQKPKIVYYDK